MKKNSCYHCGDPQGGYQLEGKHFCCLGCLSVYEIIRGNNLEKFYELNSTPGLIPEEKALYSYDFLDEEKIREKLIDFEEENMTSISFLIPSIHCSSCIWLLEHLPKINPHIIEARVDFRKKNLQVLFDNKNQKLSQLAKFLAKLGYKPLINLSSIDKKKKTSNKNLVYKIAVAFFCFGNIMLLAFPEYIGAQGDPWLIENENFLRGLMFLLSLPVLCFSASDYLLSAYRALKYKFVIIDVPISLGILVVFFRSSYEVFVGEGPGYFDSFTGLIFFMLVGKYFQARTYDSLAFDRDYKSFYPIAVLGLREGKEQILLLSEIKKGDRILIRNEEIIPADCILIRGEAKIDNSFISGESKLIKKKSGDRIYAGGKQKGQLIELEIIKEVEQSYLRQLWNNKAFKKKDFSLETLANKWGNYFTPVVLLIAFLTAIYWYNKDFSKLFQALCAVLIVACPCALSLSTPFTFGSIMRIMGKYGFFLKEIHVIEQLAKINSIVFDKTGTLTENEKSSISFLGNKLNEKQKQHILMLVKNSTHPLSKLLYAHLIDQQTSTPIHGQIKNFEEIPGNGLHATIDGLEIKIGSANYLGVKAPTTNINQAQVFILVDKENLGSFVFSNKYRKGIKEIFQNLNSYKIALLSGDNDAEKAYLSSILGKKNRILFYQTPQNKLDFIEKLQKNGDKVMMLGDGLNDAGALKQAEVGIAISENVNNFSPNCDALMQAKSLEKLPFFLKLAKAGTKLVKVSFVISIFYNLVGLSFAISGRLTPLVAAILMPMSSISIVLFASLSTRVVAFWIKKKLI